jgi:hypothetical protein
MKYLHLDTYIYIVMRYISYLHLNTYLQYNLILLVTQNLIGAFDLIDIPYIVLRNHFNLWGSVFEGNQNFTGSWGRNFVGNLHSVYNPGVL